MHTDPPDLDAKFEQWLLDAARRDTPPPELTRQAWARFAKTSGQLAAAAAGGALLSRFGRGALLSKWAWLGAGLLAGSAITLAVLRTRETPLGQREYEATAAAVAHATLDTVAHATLDTEPREQDEPREQNEHDTRAPHEAASSELASSTRAEGLPTPPRRPLPSPPAAPAALQLRRAPAASAPSSTLAAEVRALDAVRSEIESGHPDRALTAVKAFHRLFPRAQLAADAEGLAIEALLARGDRHGAAQRARQFLLHYPEDPHAARFEPIAAER